MHFLTNDLFGRRNIAKLALEGAVVVASILVAFALDAWWAERQLRDETVEDLAIVEHELGENLRLVQLTIEIMQQVVAATDTLVAELEAHPEPTTVDIKDTTIFWAIFINPTLDPSLGGTDAWIAAGRLAGLDSAELRQRLASVRGKVEDVVEEQRVAREIGVHDIYPLLKDLAGDIALVQQLYREGFHARQATSVRALTSGGVVPVTNSSALKFLLRARAIWYEASIHETRDFQAELMEVQALLEVEIDRLRGH